MSLPKLPEPAYVLKQHHDPRYDVNYYTEAQMLEFRRQTVEACAAVCESMWGDGGDANDFAQAIRAMLTQGEKTLTHAPQ